METRIVQYKNHINELQFINFTSADYNLLMYLMSEMRDKDEDIITVSLSDVKRIIGYERSTEEFTEVIEQIKDKLASIRAKVRNGSVRGDFTLFPTLLSDIDNDALVIRVNPDFKWLINDFKSKKQFVLVNDTKPKPKNVDQKEDEEKDEGYTFFELVEFVGLKSKYSKTLFRLLKQYKDTGWLDIKIEELRRLLDCPPSYGAKHITDKIIMPSIEELQKDFEELGFTPIRAEHKRGRPVTRYKFTFKADRRQGIPDMQQSEQKKSRQKDKPRKTKFSNFNERDYNYSDLEKVLLNQ